MNVPNLLKKKRDGGEFTKEEIQYLITGMVKGDVKDAQIGALLMAMYIKGLNQHETVELTRAMVSSGDQLTWNPKWNDILVDKHSTGGVGDKISLMLAPILAACGLKVPMVSGRSLEHTGGTLDKLESIPGFVVDLDQTKMNSALEDAGCFIMAATSNLCPADRMIYRVRDVTSTVDNINLIVTSVISKKVASGSKFLVIDVKVGKAAFCKTEDMGRALGKELIRVATELGMTTKVVLTRMDEPLGRNVGNSLEVEETVQYLSGDCHPQIARLVNVFGAHLLLMTKKCKTVEEGEQMIQKVVCDGSAMDRFHKMCVHQGVDEATISKLLSGEPVLPTAKYTTDFETPSPGWISDIDAMAIAQVCQHLGAARLSPSSLIDHGVGVQVHHKVGEELSCGDVWLTAHHSMATLPQEMFDKLTNAITISPTAVKQPDVVIAVIDR